MKPFGLGPGPRVLELAHDKDRSEVVRTLRGDRTGSQGNLFGPDLASADERPRCQRQILWFAQSVESRVDQSPPDAVTLVHCVVTD